MEGLLNRTAAGLLVVDVQEKLAAAMPRRGEVVEACVRLVRGFRRLELPIFLTEQYPKGLGATVAELQEALAGVQPIQKMTFSCCGLPDDSDQPLARALAKSGCRQVVVCGMEAHVCVLQTAFGLLQRQYAPHVVADAVCSRRDDHRDNALARLLAAGVTVTNHESVLFELLEVAGTPEFKDVSRLVR
jgi:nicotinamidase-related amidase